MPWMEEQLSLLVRTCGPPLVPPPPPPPALHTSKALSMGAVVV